MSPGNVFFGFYTIESWPYNGRAFEPCIVCWVSIKSLGGVLVEQQKVKVQNCDFLLLWAIKLWTMQHKNVNIPKKERWQYCSANFQGHSSRNNFSGPPHKKYCLQNVIACYIFKLILHISNETVHILSLCAPFGVWDQDFNKTLKKCLEKSWDMGFSCILHFGAFFGYIIRIFGYALSHPPVTLSILCPQKVKTPSRFTKIPNISHFGGLFEGF